jgi:DNA excision repair protein ERCC-2
MSPPASSARSSGGKGRPVRGPFPYRPRPSQEAILRQVTERTRRGGALLLDAPTGTGKTVAVLSPLIPHARESGHKVLYLVRTHSQSAQVLSETRAIARRSGTPVLALALEGRQARCLLFESMPEMEGASAEEIGKLCADRKRATERPAAPDRSGPAPARPPGRGGKKNTLELTDLEGCPYYARLLSADLPRLTERISQEAPDSYRFKAMASAENLCPYELAKRLCREATVVVAPYVFFFHPRIRPSLLTWLGVPLDQVDLVIDEAHNLPEYLRESITLKLALETVRRAREEVEEQGDFPLIADPPTPGGPLPQRPALAFLSQVEEVLLELVEEYAGEEDGLLPPGALEDRLLTEVGGTSHDLRRMLLSLAEWGERLRDRRRQARHLPRSYAATVAEHLLSWGGVDPPEYVKAVVASPRQAVEAYALDAREPAAPVLGTHLSVHLSGTLVPLEEYRDTLGLPMDSSLLTVPSPFPPSHRVLRYAPDVTSRHEELQGDPEALPRLYRALVEVLQELPVKTAAFFPSFALLDRFLAQGLSSELPRGAVMESRRMPTEQLWNLVEGFKRSPGAGILLGVCGGRVAEGIDFPDEELEAVVLVGIPFPRPTARREALIRYLDHLTGRGWEYGMVAPARRALLQALGRMIRSEDDRGLGIILDRRAAQFADALPGLKPLVSVRHEVERLFGGRRRSDTVPSRAGRPRQRPEPVPGAATGGPRVSEDP